MCRAIGRDMDNVRLLEIVNKYLEIFPAEKERLIQLINIIKSNKYEDLADWNNFNGHLVATGIIYAVEEEKFVALYHKDLKRYLCPGGHVDLTDIDMLMTARREAFEETGLEKLKEEKICELELVPIDIDKHKIEYNERFDLPEHVHFDFRYLFVIDRIMDIKLDTNEHRDYKWIDIEELKCSESYGRVANKIEKLILNK